MPITLHIPDCPPPPRRPRHRVGPLRLPHEPGRPLLLDLFCGAGGAAVGYHRAGWNVIGVDMAPQPRYPFPFVQADALNFPIGAVDAVHASPLCKAWTVGRWDDRWDWSLDQIPRLRDRLVDWGGPYVIENVPGSPLVDPWVLCGSMFPPLMVRRHRLFESNANLGLVPPCDHGWQEGRVHSVSGHGPRQWEKRRKVDQVRGHSANSKTGYMGDWRKAMDIWWMTRDELSQAIPPAMTEWVGHRLRQFV